MRVENRRIILLTTLSVVAILVNIVNHLVLKLRKETGSLFLHWLKGIDFVGWGWILVFIFGGMAFVGAICWKLESILLRVIFVIVSGAALAWALLWFYMACFFELPT